jgi:hypothetical protein
MWRDLALLYLERKDPAKAATIAMRVESPREIASMIVDRRFDSVTNAAPVQSDVRVAQEREITRLRPPVGRRPRPESTFEMLTED